MTKNELKAGMLVRTKEFRNAIYQVSKDTTIIKQFQGFLFLDVYESDMTDRDDETCFDVMEVRDCQPLIDMDASDAKVKLHYAWMRGEVLWARNTSPEKLDLEIQELFDLLATIL